MGPGRPGESSLSQVPRNPGTQAWKSVASGNKERQGVAEQDSLAGREGYLASSRRVLFLGLTMELGESTIISPDLVLSRVWEGVEELEGGHGVCRDN